MIYFVRDPGTGHIKIGFSVKPWSRFRHLQISSPTTLELVAITDGTVADEKALHQRFSPLNVRGEWFRNEGAVAQLLTGLPTPTKPFRRARGWNEPATPLRAYRQRTGARAAELARTFGLSVSQFSRIERSGTDSLKLAIRLAELTGANIAEFQVQDRSIS